VSSRTAPNFCPQCGESLSPGDAFCSACGAAVGDRATGGPSQTRNTQGRATAAAGRTAFRRRVEDLAIEGWDVKRDYGDRVVMLDRGIGSLGMHALLLVFTSGVGNLLYAWYSYSVGAERVELREDGTERYLSDDGNPAGTGWDLKSAVGVVTGLSLASLFALVGVLLLWVTSSLVPTAIALVLLLAGLVSVPLGTQFAPGFESPTTFGRHRTTDERVANAPNTPCVACSRPVGTGVRRTFVKKRYVAGVPVETINEGENCYCRSCANGEPFEADLGDREKSVEFA
jgi:hypothetical protein